MKKLNFDSLVFIGFILVVIFVVSSIPGKSVENNGIAILPIGYHLIVYFFIGAFLYLSFSGIKFRFILVIILGILLSVLDEMHQYFTPGRGMTIFDLGIDLIGILFGIVFVKLFEEKEKAIKK